MTSKGRRLTYLIISLGLLVLVVAVYAFRGPILEQWYLWELESDDDQTRRTAAKRLGDIGSSRAVRPLIDVLRREVVAENDGKRGLRELHYSAKALVKIGKPAVPELIETLADKGPKAGVIKSHAGKALREIGSEAFSDLSAAVKNHENRNVRWIAAEILRDLGPMSVPSLVKALQDEDENVRQAAATAVGTIGVEAKQAIPALLVAAKDDTAVVRRTSLSALVNLEAHPSLVVPIAVQGLKDKEVRQRALSILGNLGQQAKTAVPALIELLQAKNETVQVSVFDGRSFTNQNERLEVHVAKALGMIGPDAEAAVQELTNLLQDEDEQVRSASADALKKIQEE